MTFTNILLNPPAMPASSDGIVAAAATFAKRTPAKFTVFDVNSDLSWALQFLSGGWEQTIENISGTKRKSLHRIAESLRQHGLEVDVLLGDGRLSDAISESVIENKHDLVMKVAEGTANRSGLIGSTDLRLIRQCPCPVLVIRPDDEVGFQHVAVAVDVLDRNETQQRLDETTLRVAANISQREMSLIYALPTMHDVLRVREHDKDLVTEEQMQQWDADLESAASDGLRDLAEPMTTRRTTRRMTSHVLRGKPEIAIPDFVNSHEVDLLVMGTVARRGAQGFAVGNTAERILEQVACSVLVLKNAGSDHHG